MTNEILNHKIEYRDQLNLDPAITFGTEIEFAKLDLKKLKKYMDAAEINWDLKRDRSISLDFFIWTLGGEISSPVLTDNKETWKQLSKTCNILKELDAMETDRCGGHIHIGSNIIPSSIDSYIDLFKLISVYEPILYRFGYGEYISYRENAKDFAQPNRKRFHELINKLERIKYIDFEDIFPYILGTKQYGINFHNINQKQTIEFRMPNGTIEEIIWQNNINFYISFLKYMTSAKFDPEFIDYKYQNIDMQKENLNNYCALHLKDAIELSNMIFAKELDKMNFLRQYVKGGEESIRYTKTKNKFI